MNNQQHSYSTLHQYAGVNYQLTAGTLTQQGKDDPVFEYRSNRNSIPSLAFKRKSKGIYECVSSGNFPEGRTRIILQLKSLDTENKTHLQVIGEDRLEISTVNKYGELHDSILNHASLAIFIYDNKINQ